MWVRRVAVWVVLVLVTLMAGPAGAQGATFTVTATADAADATAGNGVCATVAPVRCTLRAAIQEANALAAGAPHTIAFAIPASDPNFNVGTGVFTIIPAAVYPTLSRAGTILDGASQATSAAGDTNPGTLGTGGGVGVDALTLPQAQRPEILIRDNATLATGLVVGASNVQISGIAIHGFGTAGTNGDIVVQGAATTGVRITGNVIGSGPTAFAPPGVAAQQTAGNGITINAPDNGFVQDNLIGFAGFHGIVARGTAVGWTFSGNETRGNGRTNNAAGGIAIEAVGTINNTIRGNLVVASGGAGIDTAASVGPNTFVNNTITGNGVFNNATAETPGLRIQGSNNLIDRNVINANYGAGVMVVNAAATNRITRNALFANGTITNLGGTAATGQVGIDLLVAANSQTRGTAPFRSLNDVGDVDTGGNAITNFPILETAQMNGGNLVVTGIARPGATIELFAAAPDPSGFGEGQTFLATAVEGSPADSDVDLGAYGPGAINGIVQGSDTTARFRFVIPVLSLAAPISAATVLTATATVGSATSEFSGNAPVVQLAADLTVGIADTPDPVAVGQPLTYAVAVTNTGPGDTPAATTTHTLPAGATFVAATPSQGSCVHAAGVVTCSLGAMANGFGATIVVTIVPTTLGSISSTVTASSPEPDPTTPNLATAVTSVTASADLGIAMLDTPDPVGVGQTVTYTVVVTNGGPDPALGVTVSDTLPSGLTLLGVSSSQGSCTAAIACALGTIPGAAAAVITVTARADVAGAITNTAIVASASADGNASNNTARATTTVTGVATPPPPAEHANADLNLVVHTSRSGVSPKGHFTAVTAIATNTGAGPATGATMTLRIRGGEVVSIAKSTGTCTTSRTGTERTVTCSVGRIEPSARATVAVVVDASRRGRVGATGSVATDLPDPSPADTTDVAATPQPPLGRLAIRVAAPSRVLRSQLVPYTITVRNTSSRTARDVIVAIAPPDGAAAAGPIAVRNPTSRVHGATPSRTLSVVVGDLAAGETRVVSLVSFVGRQLGSRHIVAAVIAVDGVGGAHASDSFGVVGGLRSVPVTG